jgi:hypothetical protein
MELVSGLRVAKQGGKTTSSAEKRAQTMKKRCSATRKSAIHLNPFVQSFDEVTLRLCLGVIWNRRWLILAEVLKTISATAI